MTNGWVGPGQYRFLPIEEVARYQSKDPDQAEGVAEMAANAQGADRSEAASQGNGPDQELGPWRAAHVRAALQVSAPSEAFGYEVMLLNPEVVTPDGEWEAWLVGSKLPGVARWPSFWQMLHEMMATDFPEHPPETPPLVVTGVTRQRRRRTRQRLHRHSGRSRRYAVLNA